MSRFFSVLRSFVFVYLIAVIMAVGSERMFWFWTPGLTEHFEVAAFYAMATAAGVALMRRFNVTSWWSLMLVTPVVAFVVEGSITPVIYTGGPMVPVFPAWFTFWHGMLSLVGLVFVARRMLLDEAMLRLSVVSIALGGFWALWSATLRLPENVNDAELVEATGALLQVLNPVEFTRYVFVMTAVLIVAHWLIGFVWPSAGRSSGRTGALGWRERAAFGLVMLGVVVWTFAVPWALPMFAAYCWIQLKGLRWHRASVNPTAVSLIDQLAGRVRLRALLPLLLMAPTAAGSYALLWDFDPADPTLRVIMYGTITAQGLIGVVVATKALLRARRISASSASSTSPQALSPTR